MKRIGYCARFMEYRGITKFVVRNSIIVTLAGLAARGAFAGSVSVGPPSALAAYEEMVRQTGKDNALVHYARACELADPVIRKSTAQLMGHPPGGGKGLLDSVVEGGWSPPQAGPILPGLQQCKEALEEIRTGAALNHAEHLDPSSLGPKTPMLNSFDIQTLGKLICVAGKYQESQGQPGIAVSNYLAALTMGRDCGARKAPMMCALVGIAVQRTALNCLRAAIASGKLDAAILQHIAQTLAQVEERDMPIKEGLYSEAVTQRWTFDQLKKAARGDAQAKASLGLDDPRMPAEIQQLFQAGSEAVLKDPEGILKSLAEVFELNEAQWSAPPFERDDAAYASKLAGLNARLPGMMRSQASMSEADARFQVVLTLLRIARVETALALHRLENGSAPASSGDLVPAYLAELPVDPYTGKPLEFLKSATGFTVFGTGPDRQPQSDTTPYDPTNGVMSAGDIRF